MHSVYKHRQKMYPGGNTVYHILRLENNKSAEVTG